MSSVVSPIKLVPSDRSEPRVNIVEKTDEEILAIADPLCNREIGAPVSAS